ncbi:type VII secretion-associated serine protease mycosin [Actinophytocola sp. NPDC049390]|uniref:type VII secretion-associated serine protease mycosin n=1 Tax=Actinophytocola sp. NPDC049390 TaxID=3363894 RepID=UPI0037A66BB9
MAVTRTTRVLSVLAATSLAFAPVAPAAAQPSSEPDAPAKAGPTPPPLPPGFATPVDSGEPDHPYTPKTQCVSSKGSTAPLEYKPWGQDMLQFEEISKFATGKGQKVAVIDTGVTPHDYFQNRLEGGGDYVVKKDRGLLDCDGHGTEVAGIIAANPKNESIGFRGIAPDAGIVSIRQSSANYEYKNPETNQSSAAGNLGTLAQAIVRAANTPGVTVINMSVDSCRPASAGEIFDPERQVQAALRYAVEERDVVPVASAGNLPERDCKEQNSPDPKNPTQIVIPPWFSKYVLSVAAMNDDGSVAEFSMTGPWVSVAAPGTDIISLDPANSKGLANQTVDDKGNAQPIQGTSFAAPYVAGLAALVRERFPELDARQVMDRIKSTASHPAAKNGHDNLVGHGMINPIAALTAFIPAEENIPADKAIDVPFEMPPPYERNWTPMQVAMIGSGGGLGLLLLTLFVVHTVKRNRRPEPKPRPRN